MGQPTIEQNAAKLAEDIAGAFAADVHAAFRELLTPILASAVQQAVETATRRLAVTFTQRVDPESRAVCTAAVLQNVRENGRDQPSGR
jgi:stage V sporulation protein SpoVS